MTVYCGTNVGEEKFFESLVERDYLLDLRVLKKAMNPVTWSKFSYAFISIHIILLRTGYTKVLLVCVCFSNKFSSLHTQGTYVCI